MTGVAHTIAPLISRDVLQAPHPIVLTLAGAGCDPCVFEGAHTHGIAWHAVDWFEGEGAFDPESIAQRLADALAPRTAPTILAGHSLGAFIALLMALRHGSRVQGLVLSNTGARMEAHADSSLPQRVRTRWQADTQEAFLRACFEFEPPAHLWSRMCRYLAQLPAERMLAAVEGLRKLDVSGELDQVQCPTLIAHGQHDRKRTEAAAQLMADGIAQARLVWLPGGHTPMVDCPGAYRDAVHDFFIEAGGTHASLSETP
jgi:pimeloyl-ACP methyl ester carboxylesterase